MKKKAKRRTASTEISDEDLRLEREMAALSTLSSQDSSIPSLTPSLLYPPTAPDGVTKRLGVGESERELEIRWWGNRPVTGENEATGILHILADTYPERYSEMIGEVAMGASVHSCFAAMGVPRSVIDRWFSIASRHVKDGIDSYYSRFAFDVLRAQGIATKEAEKDTYSRNKLLYLAKGGGRAISDAFDDGNTGIGESAVVVRTIPAIASETTIDSEDPRKIKRDAVIQKAIESMKESGVTVDSILKAYESQQEND